MFLTPSVASPVAPPSFFFCPDFCFFCFLVSSWSIGAGFTNGISCSYPKAKNHNLQLKYLWSVVLILLNTKNKDFTRWTTMFFVLSLVWVSNGDQCHVGWGPLFCRVIVIKGIRGYTIFIIFPQYCTKYRVSRSCDYTQTLLSMLSKQ